MNDKTSGVLILGAGINGCALARELLLNRVPVWLVDVRDIASGTTGYSSHLIHGGLRYLEYGEFALVRESLAERGRLLRLAPQYVRPLELSIPGSGQFGGLARSALQFLRLGWLAKRLPIRARGLAVVKMGLKFYDAYARDSTLPPHRVDRADDADMPPVDRQRYQWICSYYDAQVVFPERFTLALVADAALLAKASGVPFHVYNYHEALRVGASVEIRQAGRPGQPPVETIAPAAIVNATGAWVDETLRRLAIEERPLIGGTRGAHFFTSHLGLRVALGGRGIYAEARDGRPIFILPLAGMTIVGTTDEPSLGDPAEAVASDRDIDYLLDGVRRVFPQISIRREDIAFSYCGIRPLPHAEGTKAGAITRRHWMEKNTEGPPPVFSIIGGKLTTCRSLAESAAKTLLAELHLSLMANSEDRVIPGGDNYPVDQDVLVQTQDQLAARLRTPIEEVRAAWTLLGSRAEDVLNSLERIGGGAITNLPYSRAFVRWVIQNEYVHSLDDLVERRLMLLYYQGWTRGSLVELAKLLAEEGLIDAKKIDQEVDAVCDRLRRHFGKTI